MPTVRHPSGAHPRAAQRHGAWRLVALLGAIGLWTSLAGAVEVESLYTVRVPLESQQPEARNMAYERALQQVLIRITGSESAGFSPDLLSLFPDPARYVLQFRPGENDTLWVSLDGRAIAAVLQSAGQLVWGRERPLTVLWLAVDWGQGDRELLLAEREDSEATAATPAAVREQAMRERIRRVAEARGIPVMFPPADTRILQEVTISDVWGGFHERLVEASRQFDTNSILVGRLRPGAGGGNRWSYYLGARQHSWDGSPEDAIHLLADTLAGEYAFANNEPLDSVVLTISNVRSVTAYAEVQQMIGALQMIDEYRIDRVTEDRIRYRVRINGGVERLAAALDFNSDVQRTVDNAGYGPDVAPGSLSYVYTP